MSEYCCEKFKSFCSWESSIRAIWKDDKMKCRHFIVGYSYRGYPDDPGYGEEDWDNESYDFVVDYCPFCGEKLGK